MEAREREEKSERNKVSRRVFGAETDTRATTWTRSLFMLGAIFVFLAAYPKFVGWLCSYFEPLDTAVSAYEALTSNVGLDLRIMRATSTATFKVVALCAVITGLMREGKLPLETPVVVSKLAFNVMLPAYLCTRVAATLYLSPLTKALAILPISAMAQVIFGSIIGVGVTYFVNRFHAYASSHTREEEDLDEEEEIKLEREKRDMSRLGIAACSFGNTFTLPLVFLTEVLGRARADETAGYIALYLIGWTPVLWTVGFLLIAGPVAVAGLSKDGEKKDALRDAFLTAKATMARIGKELLNPPLLGIIAGVLIGATPLKEIFVGNFADATTEFPAVLTFISVIFRALFELAASIGAAALPGQMLVLASSLVKITPEDVEKRIARAKKAKGRSSDRRRRRHGGEREEEEEEEFVRHRFGRHLWSVRWRVRARHAPLAEDSRGLELSHSFGVARHARLSLRVFSSFRVSSWRVLVRITFPTSAQLAVVSERSLGGVGASHHVVHARGSEPRATDAVARCDASAGASFSGIDVAPIRLCHHSRHILAHRLHVGSRVTFFTSHPTQCISNVTRASLQPSRLYNISLITCKTNTA